MEEKKRNNEVMKESMVCITETESEANTEEVMTKKSPIRVYARDSMERFGDDLTEQVIQYLWFSDKVMFECLSKQWQRLVLNKQMEIDLNHKVFYRYQSMKFGVNRQALESFLKKCPNISRVVLWREGLGEELDLITKYCRRVSKLVIPRGVDRQQLIEFGDKHGQWLEEFGFGNISAFLNNYVKEFLQMCPNIKKIGLNKGWNVIDTTHHILVDSLKKLEVINEIAIPYYNNSCRKMEPFVAKYGKSLKKIRFHFKELSSNNLKTCLTLISRIESLESLGIEVINLKTEVEPIDECLKLLANKCTKLKELRLRTTNSLIISDNIFFSLSEFRSLERLIFNSTLMGHWNGSVECLKYMTRLKHLSIDYSQLTEDFFANIQTLLPNVQSLDINIPNIGYNSIKSFVESLQSMKYIERVVFNEQTFFYCKNRSESQPRILI